MMKRWTIMLLAGVLAAGPARAQEAQGDPSQGTGPQPSPNAAPVAIPICTDRPTKANVACTVPRGDVQIESDLIDWTRMTADGTRQDTILYTNPTVKVGIGTHTDVQLNLAPYETVRTRSEGTVEREGGIGDLTLRLKQRLTADKAKTQVSLIPFVKAPTARAGIGNGRWEGGIAAAANIPVPFGFTLTLGPELDLMADEEGHGHHPSLVALANLSHPLTKKVNLFAELWAQQDHDPAGIERERSADVAATFQLSDTLQLDVGGNFGLNRETPGKQLYAGVSTRF